MTAAHALTMADRLRARPLGFGTMAIGGQHADVSDADAVATLRAAFDAGIRMFDTAPQYGCGLAEDRLGLALRELPRTEMLIATKVGKRIAPLDSGGERQCERVFPGGHDLEMVFDYSRDGTERIVSDSLRRLGTETLDIVLIHDVTRHFHGEDGVHRRFDEAMEGAIPVLHRLRDAGVVRAIGTGLKDVDIAARFVEEADIDVVLLPGRLTLLDQSGLATGLADLCVKHDVALIAAGPFDSGILATGSVAAGPYGYRPATTEMIARVEGIERICARHGVPLQAAALQFARRHPAVTTVLSGMRNAHEIRQNMAWMHASLPEALWADLAAETGLMLP